MFTRLLHLGAVCLALTLAACSSASTPTAPIDDAGSLAAVESLREVQGEDPGEPPAGCPQLFAIQFSCLTPLGRVEIPAKLLVDACITPDQRGDAFMAVKLNDSEVVHRFRGWQTREGECRVRFLAEKVTNVGTPQHGKHIREVLAATIETCIGEEDRVNVAGHYERHVVLWWTDDRGVRHERRIDGSCPFAGVQVPPR